MSRKFWTQADLALLAKLYPDHRAKEIAEKLGRTLIAIYGAARKLGLNKTPEFLQRECRLKKGQTIGRSWQFRKGQTPANKGLRRPGWYAGRMRETQFKKGQRTGIAALNWKPIGTIMPDAEGYLHIKVRDAVHGKEHTGFGNLKVWPLYNRYLWEQHKGPIPAGHHVSFKDRNRLNCVIENLELVSQAEMARRNRMWSRLPRELAEAIQLNGVLKRKLRRANGEKQN